MANKLKQIFFGMFQKELTGAELFEREKFLNTIKDCENSIRNAINNDERSMVVTCYVYALETFLQVSKQHLVDLYVPSPDIERTFSMVRREELMNSRVS